MVFLVGGLRRKRVSYAQTNEKEGVSWNEQKQTWGMGRVKNQYSQKRLIVHERTNRIGGRGRGGKSTKPKKLRTYFLNGSKAEIYIKKLPFIIVWQKLCKITEFYPALSTVLLRKTLFNGILFSAKLYNNQLKGDP